jgi:hypothetical protein
MLFAIVAGLVALLALVPAGGTPAALGAWVLLGGAPGVQNTELDRWHDAQWGGLIGALVGAGARP